MKKIFSQHKIVLFLLVLYFLFATVNFLRLPIYNDEAIYIDWGWVETHLPGHLFESLYDAKQPFLMWIFSLAARVIHDPLLAGRGVTVIIGAISMLGIFRVTKKLFDKNSAIIASVLFTITPIILFYNRLALMEGAVACVGIWALYALISVCEKPTGKNAALLGFILGVGFFVKSSALLFISASILVLLYYSVKEKNIHLFKKLLLTIGIFIATNFLLFIQPLFWATLSSNSRYSLTLPQLLHFPFGVWLHSLLGMGEIGIIFVSPVIFILGMLGTFTFSKKNKNMRIFALYFLIALFLEIFSAKNQNQRYLMPFLSLLVIPAGAYVWILWKKNIWGRALAIISFSIPLVMSLLLIVSPIFFITSLSQISHYSNTEYVYGQMSGFGVQEAVHYLDRKSKSSLIMVGIALNAGTPESAVDAYMDYNPHAVSFHMADSLIPDVFSYQCLSSQYPVYFVARNHQLAGLERYFVEEKRFQHPYSPDYSIGVYTLKKNCRGKRLSLSDLYAQGIAAELEIK